MPLASHRPAIATPATPADPARPRSGERANARPPKNIARQPTHSAKPTEDSSGIASPRSAFPKTFELKVVMSGQDEHGQPEQGEVCGQLLQRDAALAERGDRQEVEAAAAGLASQGPRERQDGPGGRAQGEDGAVFEGHVATQRADLRADEVDIAEQPHHRLRDGAEEGIDLEPRRGRGEDVGHGDAHDEGHAAEQAGRDDEGQPGVADRLAVDGAEAVQTAAQGDGGEGRDALRYAGLDGHR